MSGVSWKAKADVLQTANTRLKQEATKREEQLKEIKRQFKSIVEELQKRELPDGAGGNARGKCKDTDEFIKIQEARLKEVSVKFATAQKSCSTAQKMSEKWEQRYKQLKQSRARSRDPSVDEWKRKYEALKAKTDSTQKQQPSNSVQAVRALRPRRAFEETASVSGRATSPIAWPLSPPAPSITRPRLMNAWVQTVTHGPSSIEQQPQQHIHSIREKPLPTPSQQQALHLQEQIMPIGIDGTTTALITTLRKENLSLQFRVEEVFEEKNNLEKELTLMAHERDILASRGAEAAYMKSDVVDLQREVVEKNAKLVLLDSRVKQAQQAAESMKSSQVELIQELERLNDNVVTANERALEAENALQVAKVGMGRIEGLDERMKARDEEVRLLNEEVNRLMQKCHTIRDEVTRELRDDYERLLEERQKQLEDSERNNKQLFRDVQFATEQRDEMHGNWVKVQKERDALDTEAITLRGKVEALTERVRLFGPGAQVDQEEDVHKALALIQHHKRKGDPTDLEFLIKAWDVPDSELGDLRAENAALLRELEVAKKALQTREMRIEMEAEKIIGLRNTAEDKNALLDNMGDKVRRLTNELAEYRGIGKKCSTDSDVSSVLAGDNETVLEVSLSHLTVDMFDGDTSIATFCLSFDFLDFETCITETLTGRSLTFSKTFCFTIEVSNALRHYIQHKEVDVELHYVDGVKFESIAKGKLSLKGLLAPASCLSQGHIGLLDSETRVASLEYTLRLQHALPLDWGSHPTLPAAGSVNTTMLYNFRHIKSLKVVVHECRGLVCSTNPVPYVLVTPVSSVVTDKVYLQDLTVDMSQPQHTRDPIFHFTHEYPISMDSSNMQYLKGAFLSFIVLDDGALDPQASMIGKASVALSPLLESTASTINAVLELNNSAGVAGTIVVELRWVKQMNALPVYVEGL